MEKQGMIRNKTVSALLFIAVLIGAVFLGAIFYRSTAGSTPDPGTQNGLSTPRPATSAGVWDELLEVTPFPYFTPLPEAVSSKIDGTYAKIDQSWPQWWRCLRCADYRVTGGIWKLQFDKGVMRIFYEVNNWRSIASYKVSSDRLFIFNDPYCPENTGEYRWSIQSGELSLEPVQDACAFDLRAENLAKQTWISCTGGVPGCEGNQEPDPSFVTPQPPLQVNVYGGDSRFFSEPPEIIAHANSADMQPPEGISVSFAEESIPYGLSRVLWWNGSWSEATFDGSYSSAGVQFLGEGMIGWARVLLDGQEVWRGNTSKIWSKSGRHGGFVEVSGFDPGVHTLRVESLGFDYRPVTVAGFGFGRSGGAAP
jgi:hypothetical protein